MPTYAVLGATGNTGGEIVKSLWQQPEIHLNIYVRNKAKLEAAFPGISSSPSASIFTGSISDPSTLSPCLASCSAIFMTVATNVNTPGLSVARETAAGIVHALERARSTAAVNAQPWSCPRVIWLASAVLHEPIAKQVPALARALLYRAEWYVYEDSRLALEYLETQAPWLPVTRACPGAIVKGKKVGSVYGVRASSFTISYADLADAMVGMATDESVKGIGVGVSSKGDTELWLFLTNNVPEVLRGFVFSYLPGSFTVCKSLGLV